MTEVSQAELKKAAHNLKASRDMQIVLKFLHERCETRKKQAIYEEEQVDMFRGRAQELMELLKLLGGE